MTPPSLTGSALAAWHRSEADRIEAEERARRPALDYEGLLALAKEQAKIAVSYLYPPGDARIQRTEEAMAHSLFMEYTVSPLYSALRSRDVLRVVPPKWEEERNLLLELESLYRGTSRESREMNAVLRKLDAVHNPSIVVPPDPPAPQVAPEPTGAELVGRRCWVRHEFNPEWQDRVVQKYDPADAYCYGTHPGFPPYGSGSLVWWKEAKLYVEGVAP